MDTKKLISKKVQTLSSSGIRKFFDIPNREGLISLGVGEPDFSTPLPIRKKAIEFIEEGHIRYTSNYGIIELRQEIIKYTKEKIGITYSEEEEILVTVGGSEAIDLALRAILDNGDEVILIKPAFVSYEPFIIIYGGVPISIDTTIENNFKVKPEDILEKITPKTKAIILSYPNNPTGAILTKSELEEIAEVLKDKDILIISDEIYSELNYSGDRNYSIAEMPNMKEKTLILNGMSKSFSMTGWRLGYALGPKEIIQAMLRIHQYAVMAAPTISQHAALAAFRESLPYVKEMREEFDFRRKFMVEGFRSVGMDCFEALGAFYLFPSIKNFRMKSEEFCMKLLEEENLIVIPGNVFGDCGEGFIRCSYAYSIELIEEALKRIKSFASKHMK